MRPLGACIVQHPCSPCHIPGSRSVPTWAFYLHHYSRLPFDLFQMGCNSFLSSFFGLFIFYFNPNNFCASCQTLYCIAFFPSSDTISSLTQAGMFPPALLCLFLLQTLISTLKAKPDRCDILLSVIPVTESASSTSGGQNSHPLNLCSCPGELEQDHHFNIRFGARPPL